MNYKTLLVEALAGAKARGLSRFNVASKAGITETTIYNWLNENNSPNIMMLAAVINACGYQIKLSMKKEIL